MKKRPHCTAPSARIPGPLLALAVAAAVAGCISTPTTLDGAAGSAGDLVRQFGGSVPLPMVGGAAPAEDTAASGVAEADLSPAEQRMRQQSRAFQRTVWEGALIGAGAGALWGALAGDDTKGILTKTAIGGAVGGLAGAYVASKQKEFASAEDQLDSMIADVRQSNREAESLIASIREVIAEDRRRLAAVEQRHRAGQATAADLAATRKRAEANRAIARDAANGAREQYAMYSNAERGYRAENPTVGTDELKRELGSFRKQIDTLDELADSITVA